MEQASDPLLLERYQNNIIFEQTRGMGRKQLKGQKVVDVEVSGSLALKENCNKY